jgi:hypothetical protein
LFSSLLSFLDEGRSLLAPKTPFSDRGDLWHDETKPKFVCKTGKDGLDVRNLPNKLQTNYLCKYRKISRHKTEIKTIYL